MNRQRIDNLAFRSTAETHTTGRRDKAHLHAARQLMANVRLKLEEPGKRFFCAAAGWGYESGPRSRETIFATRTEAEANIAANVTAWTIGTKYEPLVQELPSQDELEARLAAATYPMPRGQIVKTSIQLTRAA